MFDIIGYGSVSVDDLIFVDHYPQSDSKIEVIRRERHGGGLTGTALVTAARLGIKTALWGALGHDELSIFTINEFQKENVDLSMVLRSKIAQPIYSTIIIDLQTGERTIFYSLENVDPLTSKDIPPDLCAITRYLFIDNYAVEKFDTLIAMAKESKTPIIADIENKRVVEYPEALAAIDFLIMNIKMAAEITERNTPTSILNKLDSQDRQCSVITQGDHGCWYKTSEPGIYHLPAYHVDVLDTTGCGDVFHGAFAAALIYGKTIHDAVAWGSAAAAIKATQPGGRKGIPDLKTLQAFIEAHPQNRSGVIE